jgi:hypothetical protein
LDQGFTLMTLSNPNYYLLKASFPNAITLGIRVSSYEFWKGTQVHTSSQCFCTFWDK